MPAKKVFYNFIISSLVLVGGFIVASSFMMGCAATGPQETTLSPEKLQAKQDSLRKIWDRKLNIAWSTGYENHKNKMYRDAIKPFWRVADLDTVERFPDLYTFLGRCYENLNMPDSAEIVYRIGTEKYPEKTHYWRSLGYYLAAKNENQEAIKCYRKAVELDGTKLSDYQQLGNLLIKDDQPEEALPVWEKVLELDPGNEEAQKIIGQIYELLGMTDDAIDSWKETVKTDPGNTQILFRLSEKLFKLQEFEESIKYFNMLVEQKPDDVYSLELLGNAYQNIEKYRDAISTYEKVLALAPDNKKVICEMATCYKELGQYQKARSVVNQALRVDAEYGLAYIVRGEIYEATADACINTRDKKTLKFDDRLVYEMAYNEYQKALQDIQYADLARRRMNYIKPELPTSEHRFMNKNVTEPRLDCYQWLN